MFISGNVAAAGFALQNQNGAGTGYAYAGAAAVAQDASTIYFNPAGMTYLAPRHHVSGALNFLVRSLRFNDTGSDALLSYPLGDSGGQAGGLSVIPAVYWTMPLTSTLRLGLGVAPTFGSATDWSSTFVGRYQGISSEISAINFNPGVAWRMNDVISLGLGLNVVRLEADLRSTLPVTALLPAQVDAKTKISGNDIGFGYNLGAMFQLTPLTRLGLTYRSKVDLKVNGRLEMPGNTVRASVPVELPDTASVAISHMVNDRLQLLGDFTWTGWSSIPALVVNSRASGSILSNERLNLKDSYRAGLGAQYQYSDKFQLRTGIAYDRSPTRSATDRTVRLPDSNRIWLALGFNQKINKKTSIDVGYAHLFFAKAEINRATNNNPMLQVVRGYFNTSVDIISAQLNHQF